MMRFPELESLGLTLAGLTEKQDGDCGHRAGDGRLGREQVAAAHGFSADEIVWGQQVHGTGIRVVARGPGNIEPFSDTDGLVTQAGGLPIAIFVADCVPVYLFDPCTRSAALVHAGREGTLRGISARAVDVLVREFGVEPQNLRAVVGPSAGPCCYEVSEEMAGEFAGKGLPVDGRRLDLWGANAGQLESAGVPRSQVLVSGICTICSDRFFSYRQDKTLARNMAVVVI